MTGKQASSSSNRRGGADDPGRRDKERQAFPHRALYVRGGACLILYILPSRDSQRPWERLKQTDLRLGEHFILNARSVFPECGAVRRGSQNPGRSLRSWANVAPEATQLLMHSLPRCVFSMVLGALGEPDLPMVTCASHATHILPVFNQTLLRVVKKLAKSESPFDDVSVTTAFICAAWRDLPATIILPNISGVPSVVGIEFDARHELSRFCFWRKSCQRARTAVNSRCWTSLPEFVAVGSSCTVGMNHWARVNRPIILADRSFPGFRLAENVARVRGLRWTLVVGLRSRSSMAEESV
jgi:hypothetical protein